MSARPLFLSFIFLSALMGLGVYLVIKKGHEETPVPLSPAFKEGEFKRALLHHEGVGTGEGFLRVKEGEIRIIGFGISWFSITLSVESSVIPIPMAICEFRVYLPSVGAFIAIANAFYLLACKLRRRIAGIEKISIATMILIILMLAIAAHERNGLWSARTTLWEDAARKSPDNPATHYSRGIIYGEEGRIEDASKEYQTAVELKPDYAETHNGLGLCILKKDILKMPLMNTGLPCR